MDKHVKAHKGVICGSLGSPEFFGVVRTCSRGCEAIDETDPTPKAVGCPAELMLCPNYHLHLTYSSLIVFNFSSHLIQSIWVSSTAANEPATLHAVPFRICHEARYSIAIALYNFRQVPQRISSPGNLFNLPLNATVTTITALETLQTPIPHPSRLPITIRVRPPVSTASTR